MLFTIKNKYILTFSLYSSAYLRMGVSQMAGSTSNALNHPFKKLQWNLLKRSLSALEDLTTKVWHSEYIYIGDRFPALRRRYLERREAEQWRHRPVLPEEEHFEQHRELAVHAEGCRFYINGRGEEEMARAMTAYLQ